MTTPDRLAMLGRMAQSEDRALARYAEAVLEHFRRACDLGWAEEVALDRAETECRAHLPETF